MPYPAKKTLDVYSKAILDSTPWEKMKAETAKAYAAFISYRNIPAKERSLKRAVESYYGRVTSAKLRQFQHWSARNMWVDRAGAWDAEVDRKGREDLLKKIRDMNETHIRSAKGLLGKALQRLNTIDPLELAPSDVLRFISEAIRIERIAMGEPDSITEEQGTEMEGSITFAEMTDEQLIQHIVSLRVSKGQINKQPAETAPQR